MPDPLPVAEQSMEGKLLYSPGMKKLATGKAEPPGRGPLHRLLDQIRASPDYHSEQC